MSGLIRIHNEITNGGGIPVVIEDILANRPPAGIVGRLFITTNQSPNVIYRDNGTSWVVLITGSSGGGGTLTGANNGLGVVGSTVKLGGQLIQAITTVDTQGAATFEVIPATAGVIGGLLQVLAGGVSIGRQTATGQSTLQVTDVQMQFVTAAGSIVIEFSAAAIAFPGLANSNANAFLQASNTGVVTNVDATGKFIDNQTTPQANANYNIQGKGVISNTQADITAGSQAFETVNSVTWNAAGNPAGGSLYDAVTAWFMLQANKNITIPNSANIYAEFVRLQLSATANGIVTVAQGSFTVRVVAAFTANVYLPQLGAGISSVVDHVAAIYAQAVFQDASTTLSTLVTNYYGLLIGQSDEQLSFAAITNRFGIFQDGVNDQNVLNGPVRLAKLANTNANQFVQADSAGNLGNVAAWTDGAEANYTGTIAFAATTAPATVTNNRFSYHVNGNNVSLAIHLLYTTPGVAVTQVTCTLPAGMPAPKQPAGYSNNTVAYLPMGGAIPTLGTTVGFAQATPCRMYFDGTNWQLNIVVPTGAYLGFNIQVNYFTT